MTQAYLPMRYLLAFQLMLSAAIAEDSPAIQAADPGLGRAADFYQDVFPILEAKCLACHNVRDKEGELVLEDVPSILKGGDSGPAVVAGKPEESLLYQLAARADEPVMPPLPNAAQAKALTPRELGIFKQWISEGAKPGTPPPESEIQWMPVPDHIQSVHALALDPTKRLLAAGRANRLVIFDLAAGEPIAQPTDTALLAIRRDGQPLYQQGTAHQDFIHAIAFSPDGNLLATGGYRVVKLWQRIRESQLHSWSASSNVSALTCNADGTIAASGHEDGTIHLWNLTNGQPGPVLKGHTGKVTGVSFSADGEQIASTSLDKTLRLWKVADGQPAGSLNMDQPPTAVLVSQDGKFLATGHQDHLIRVWDVQAVTNPPAAEEGSEAKPPVPVRELKGHSQPVTLLILVTGTDEIVSGSTDGTARVWSLSKGNQIRAFTLGAPLTGIAVDSEGKRLAASGQNGIAKIWDKANGKQLAELKGQPELARNVIARTDDLTVAKSKVALTDAEQKAADKDLKGREESLKKAKEQREEAVKKQAEAEKKRNEAKDKAEKAAAELEKKPDDAKLKKAKEDADKALKAAEEELEKAAAAIKSADRAITLSEKSLARAKTLLTEANEALKAAQAKQKSAEEALKAAQDAVKNTKTSYTGIGFSPNGKQVALATAEGRVDLYNAVNGAALESLALAGGQGLVFTTGGELVLAADKTVTVHDVKPRWKLAGRLGPPEKTPLDTKNSPIQDRVLALAFSPDGKLLLTGGGEPSRSGELLLWDVAARKIVREFPNAHSDTVFDVEFSRDGRFIVSGAADKFVKLFDAATGKLIRSYEGHTNHVLAVSIKADESTIVSGAADNEIKVWNRKTGEQKRTINNRYTKQVTSLDFIGVSDNTISCGGDKSVRLITAANGNNFRNLGGMTDFVYAVVASDDLSIVAAGGEDGVIRVWDGNNGKELMKFEPPAPEAKQTADAN